jgi:hypothetical protein
MSIIYILSVSTHPLVNRIEHLGHDPGCQKYQDILYCHIRIWVGPNPPFQNDIVRLGMPNHYLNHITVQCVTFKVLGAKFEPYLRPTNGPNGELVTNYL